MTTNRPWADLPNAAYIDAVLADVKARPAVWQAAWVAVQGHAHGDAWSAVKLALAQTVRWRVVWLDVQAAVRASILPGAPRNAGWDVICTLIAWDSSADLLDLPPDALRTLMDVAPEPVCHQAALLLPWAIVRESN